MKKKGHGGGSGTFGLGILRTIRDSLKRFISLAVICSLGTALLIGLTVACKDLRISADDFYDDQNLFDIRVISTLGLDDDDIEALSEIEGVEVAEGGYTETCYTAVGSTSEKVDVKALSPLGLNAPYVVEGYLPVTDDQIAVTEGFLEESGLEIGDTVTFHSEADDAEDAADEDDGDAAADEDADEEDADADEDAEDEDEGADDVDADLDISVSDTDDTVVFERKEYTIVASVLDPMNINASENTMSFRSSGGSDYSFFVLPSCVEEDVEGTYTVAYIRVEGAADVLCYSDEYDEMVDEVMQRVDDAREELEAARTESVKASANETIDEAEADALEQLDDAQDEIDDAQDELDDGAAEIEDGWSELESSRSEAESELADAQEEIDSGYEELYDASATLEEQIEQVQDGIEQIDDGLDELDEASDELVAARAQVETAGSMLVELGLIDADLWDALISTDDADEAQELADQVDSELSGTIETAQDVVDQMLGLVDELDDPEVLEELEVLVALAPEELQEYLEQVLSLDADDARDALEELSDLLDESTGLADGMVEIVAGEAEVAETESDLKAQREELVDALEQLYDGQSEIAANEATLDASSSMLESEAESAEEQLDEAEETLLESEDELADGQEELDDAQSTLDEERDDALGQIADARAEVDDIEDAVWYVQDRSNLASFSSVDSDASSIESIGNVIPVVFVIVGVLISLTTMTRMVDEERTLIGLYKALGYSTGRILSKYALYALASVVVGVGVGYLLGFIALPLFLFYIFTDMYSLPGYSLHFSWFYAIISFVIFAACIVGATLLACQHTLREDSASLMRPETPKAGARILLEHITPLWRRLSFLNKVTARNLFRYKRRLLMTVVGIAGTTALLVCGFGIRDTVISLSERQYGDGGVEEYVNEYDLMTVTSSDDLDDVAGDLEAEDEVESLMRIYTDSVTVKYDGDSVTAQLVVVPEGESLDGYILVATEDGDVLDLPDSGALVTINARQVLGFSTGDSVSAQDSTLAEGDMEVVEVVQNYLGNYVFMSQEAYEEAFDKDFEANGLLVNLSGTDDEQVAFADELGNDSRILSSVSTQQLIDDFSGSVALINTVVYLIIGFAAALSFTVVFTLCNTNISERERELATLKVLGFRRREVHSYINKETIILTILGIVVGLPLGWALTGCLRWVLKMPSLYFDVVIEPATYVIAAAFAIVFTLIVDQMTNRTLDRIDMVEALKSAE